MHLLRIQFGIQFPHAAVLLAHLDSLHESAEQHAEEYAREHSAAGASDFVRTVILVPRDNPFRSSSATTRVLLAELLSYSTSLTGRNMTASNALAFKLVAVKEVVVAMIAKAGVVAKTVSPLIKQLCKDAGEDN
jgi:hypothetical protein